MTEAGDSAAEPSGGWTEIFTGRNGVLTFVLTLGITLFAINQFVVATIMPTIVRELGGLDYYTWTFSLFAVGAIIGAASAGPFREALGARLSYAGAGIVLGIGLAGAASATDMPTLVVFRLIQGIGGGALSSHAYGLVATVFPAHLRGRVLAVISTVWGVATVGGPAFGGAFAEAGMWRGAFWSLAPFTVVFALLAWRHIEGPKGHGRLSQLPYWRLGLLGLSVLLISATSLTGSNGLRAILVVASLAIVAYVFRRDSRAERNMFPRRALAVCTELGAAYWVVLMVSVVLTFVNTYTTFYLQALHGISPFTAGYLFAIQSFMWTASALVVATVRRSLETALIVTGLVLILFASVGVALTVESGPVIAIAVSIGISGIGLGLMNNPTIQRIMSVASEAEKHVAGSSMQVFRNIGISFGAALSGMVAAAAGLSDGASRETVAVAMQWVYGANVMFAALAVVVVIPLVIRSRGSAP